MIHQEITDYLKAVYPGLVNDCTGYSFKGNGGGEVTLTLDLVYNPEKYQRMAGTDTDTKEG